jgi:DNA-binding response OmpR family regulator
MRASASGGGRPMARILVVDDDLELQHMLGFFLRREGYDMSEAPTGEDALKMVQRSAPDLVILDLMLPGIDGFTVCERLRIARSVPILMLTGRANEADEVRALDLGADDYLTKPFSLVALLARIRALLRRGPKPLLKPPKSPFQVGRLEIDISQGRLAVDGREVPVTRSEVAIIACMAVQPGEPVPPRALVKQALNYDCDEAQARAIVKVRISRLRQKLGDDPVNPRIIVSVRGIGYALCPPWEGADHAQS